MKRVALLVQYDGSSYSGWQRQKNATTVQEILEKSLLKITNNTVTTFAAGRTDAGVHASGQVVHFDVDCVIPGNRFSDVLNSCLPSTIRILESVEVKDGWHACYSAIYRHYRYVINNSKLPNLFINNWTWHRYQKNLDEVLMSNASKSMEGEHDFFAFQKSGSNRKNSITKIKNIDIKRVEDLILIDIKATGFLYGMVRLIVGQLVLVGEKKISPEIFTDRWVNKKKNDVKESAPAKGLCFVNAVYEKNVFKKINNYGGVFLIIDYAKSFDYGKNTLSFIYKHTHVNPFYCPGSTDISSKPDFTLIKSLAVQANCKVLGPFSQNFFLTKLGIEIRFEKLIKSNPNLSSSLLASKKRLIDKEYMGEIFKVLIITNKNNKDFIFDNYA